MIPLSVGLILSSVCGKNLKSCPSKFASSTRFVSSSDAEGKSFPSAADGSGAGVVDEPDSNGSFKSGSIPFSSSTLLPRITSLAFSSVTFTDSGTPVASLTVLTGLGSISGATAGVARDVEPLSPMNTVAELVVTLVVTLPPEIPAGSVPSVSSPLRVAFCVALGWLILIVESDSIDIAPVESKSYSPVIDVCCPSVYVSVTFLVTLSVLVSSYTSVTSFFTFSVFFCRYCFSTSPSIVSVRLPSTRTTIFSST